MIINHCIIVKWNRDEYVVSDLQEIKRIFDNVKSIAGVYDISYHENVIARDNRFDLMIKIKMEESSLLTYDQSIYHKEWKEKYSKYILKKAIFDYEEEK